MTDEQREELRKAAKVKGYFSEAYWKENNASFNRKEQVLLTFLEAVIDSGEVEESAWQKATEAFSKRQIMELLTMQVSVLLSIIRQINVTLMTSRDSIIPYLGSPRY